MGRGKDEGGAVVEFIGMTLLFLLPLVYLVVAFSKIQAGAFAADLAARDAARTSVVTGVSVLDDGATRSRAMAVADHRALSAVVLTFEDFGFDAENGSLSLTCVPPPCLASGSDIVASVEIEVALPGVPGFIRSWLPLSVTVSSEAASSVDDFARTR